MNKTKIILFGNQERVVFEQFGDIFDDIFFPDDFFSKLSTFFLGKTKEESIRELIRSIKETSADFDVKLTEDSTEFTFEPGHIVQSGALYITDPVFPNFYVPLHEYTERVFSEKMLAFKRLVGTLGAKSFQLTQVVTNQTEVKGGGSVPVAKMAGTVGASAKFTSNYKLESSHIRKFGFPDFQPYIPQDLTHWVEFYPEFRGFKSSRLEANALSDTIAITLNTSSSLGGSIEAKVARMNIELSGNYKKTASSTWVFDVEFYSKEDLAHLPKHQVGE